MSEELVFALVLALSVIFSYILSKLENVEPPFQTSYNNDDFEALLDQIKIRKNNLLYLLDKADELEIEMCLLEKRSDRRNKLKTRT